jgi:hypothetical protein
MYSRIVSSSEKLNILVGSIAAYARDRASDAFFNPTFPLQRNPAKNFPKMLAQLDK